VGGCIRSPKGSSNTGGTAIDACPCHHLPHGEYCCCEQDAITPAQAEGVANILRSHPETNAVADAVEAARAATEASPDLDEAPTLITGFYVPACHTSTEAECNCGEPDC
jgi:hypothetical protein